MSPPKLSQAFLRLLFLSSLLSVTRADPPYNNCSTDTNFTANSTFQYNLNQLLNSLSSNASISRFYSTVIGTGVDVVYGNFLCIGDVSLEICHNDVISAVQNIKRLCPTSKEAIVWEEYSQIRYSDRPFLGLMDDTGDIPLWNKLNISDPNSFSNVVKEMMGNLSLKAAFDSSRNMLATGESNFTAIEKVYGLVQCTRDLSGNDCNRCLRKALNNIQNCCYFYRGARVLSRSCYLRYELYPLDALGVANPPLPPPPPTSSSTKTDKINIGRIVFFAVIAAVSASFIAMTLFGFCLYYSVRRKGLHRVKGNENSNQEISLHDAVDPISTTFSDQNVPAKDQMKVQESPSIHFDEILRATNNFSDSNILGQGGYGPVYKGLLSDGKEVAVKRLSSNSEQGSEEFMNEVLLIMKLQHKNLVRLLGFCTEKEEKILVYEYMPNSSLDIFFDTDRRVLLDWRKRLNIINGIARGLLYLHQDSRLRIIHRDLKASNVLLDQELNPKISDFGMARPFGGNVGEANTDRIVGTYGYMAPEYAMEGIYSIKSDVFSFGVLLLEILTGKRNTGFRLSRLAPSLIAYAWRLWSEGKGLELMDPILTESCTEVDFLRCVQIGLLCVQESATNRPNMSSVVVMLGSEYLGLPQPQQPAFSVGRFVVHSEKSLNCSVNELTISSVSPH